MKRNKQYTEICKLCKGSGILYVYYTHINKYKGLTSCREAGRCCHSIKTRCSQCEGRGRMDWIMKIKRKNRNDKEFIECSNYIHKSHNLEVLEIKTK